MSDQDLSPQLFERRVIRLRTALYASLAVNALLLVGGIVFWHTEATALFTLSSFSTVKENPLPQYNASTTLQEAFAAQETRQFAELVSLFEDKTPVLDGITIRDIALSQAISQYDFNIDKALGKSCEKEKLKLAQREVVLARALSDEDFAHVKRFAESEKFPFTSQGLVALLAKDPDNCELKKACTLLPEYHVFETLFKRVYKASSLDVLVLFSSIPFSQVEALYEEEKKGLQLGEEKAKELLVKGIKNNSKSAALFLLQRDAKYAVHGLEDEDLIKVLKSFDDKEIAMKMGQLVLKSSRRDAVKQVARALVAQNNAPGKAQLSLKEIPQTTVKVAQNNVQVKAQPPLKETAKTVVKVAKVYVASPPLREKKRAHYVVQGGDTLWRISKKFHIGISALKAANHLQNEQLKPGYILEIPN